MPEAEDVILEAAERATAAARGVWERHRGAPRRGERTPGSAATRRLLVWQAAWLGRAWPVAAGCSAPAATICVQSIGAPLTMRFSW